jgi:threonine synthase
VSALVCRKTGRRYAVDQPIWRSEADGLLDLEFQPRFDLAKIRRRPPSLWRYREALPIDDDEHIVTFGEGFTPLIAVELYGRRVLLKQDHLFPTGSFKDRGASVLISKVRELRIPCVVEDSSGNAGAAIAAYCARAGVVCDIYVPAPTSPAKLAQIRLCGATLHAVPGSRADTARAAWQAAQTQYYASHVWNPYFFHGTKTFAFEVAEQMGWKAPDAVLIPTGNGTLLYGAYLGFSELRAAGIIEQLPKLIGVQAANCAPLYAAWRAGRLTAEAFADSPTIADGIAIVHPARAEQCLEAVRASGGTYLSVSEEEIRAAWLATARTGLWVEPTSAAAIAALPHCPVDGTVVIPLTGHGLKAAHEPERALTP